MYMATVLEGFVFKDSMDHSSIFTRSAHCCAIALLSKCLFLALFPPAVDDKRVSATSIVHIIIISSYQFEL